MAKLELAKAHPPVVKGYQDLHVWQKAMDLAEAVYRAARGLPPEETYGLRAPCIDCARLALRGGNVRTVGIAA